MIEIAVNGERMSVEAGLNVARLIERLGLPPGRVAIERNRNVVPRARHAEEPVEPGDSFEVVTLVGGG